MPPHPPAAEVDAGMPPRPTPHAPHVSRRVAMAAFGGVVGGVLLQACTGGDPGRATAGSPTVSTEAAASRTSAAPRATQPPASSSAGESSSVPSAPAGIPGFAEGDALVAALAGLPRPRSVTFGVGVHDRRTGRRFVSEAPAPIEMASTVKVDLAVATWLRARDAGRAASVREQALMRSMIRVSDNASATELFRGAGRAAGLAAVHSRLGLAATTSQSRWGLTTTTAADRLTVLAALAGAGPALHPADGAQILALMRAVIPSQQWGVGKVQRPGETIALKNGWLPRSSHGGRWVVATTGIVSGPDTDLHLAVLSRGHATHPAGIAWVEQVLLLARSTLRV